VTLRFSKMHGIGNDFVVIDCRAVPLHLRAADIRRMADRHRGIGFDQLLTIERADHADCAWRYDIYNQDGSHAGQCGNGARCVALWLQRAGDLPSGMVRLQNPSGVIEVEMHDDKTVRVDMGLPEFSPVQIPLLVDAEADHYTLEVAGQTLCCGAVSMGNPHAVIQVDDIATAPVATLGAALEHSAQFLQRCNVGFVEIVARDHVRLRVWERGVGETLACGSGACAAVAVLRRQKLVDEKVRVSLPGGDLQLEWVGPGQSIHMSGAAEFVFEGEWLA
jgi:diaminopimelate epimerase